MVYTTKYTKLLWTATILVLLASHVLTACTGINSGRLVNISETADNETVILHGTRSSTDNIQYEVKSGTVGPDHLDELKGFFDIILPSNTTFELVNTKPLDLEYFALTSEINIRVEAVNEFWPSFEGAPYSRNITEDFPIFQDFFDISQRVTDRDKPDTVNFFYEIQPYLISGYGAEEYFEMVAITNGRIRRNGSKILDFDSMTHHSIYLNVTVKDSQGPDAHTTSGIVNITVQDVDDQIPFWEYKDCPRPCTAPAYTVTVYETDAKSLTLYPGNLNAGDPDTLGTRLVRKDLADKDLKNIAIVNVKVYGRVSNETDPMLPPIGASKEGSTTSLLVPVIILGILLAIIIAALVAVVILYRRKQQQLTVSPEDKSAPNRGGGPAHGRRQLQRPTGHQLQAHIRDTGTGTVDTDKPKKKRSRRRNKNKEPEIFDGTKEYNMGLDAEFFESGDKSRVKRSQRSYDKKVDPATWITVPNDQPSEKAYQNI
ncbi:STAN-like protein [Mya arenaria]|uniref:STAN-like protein n=1 Tax=Mya arenaria TaxID=6604 RepID=A0ABY7DHB6_MYAAR|nr:STAN-like protein [Mya arenaria]